MPGDQFTIHRKTDKVLVYDEGHGRTIEFACRSDINPVIVWTPAEPLWANKTPPWAHRDRVIIIARLRASGAIVYEQSPELTTVLSPDGTFRVEMTTEFDDRAPAWESTRIATTTGNREVLSLPLHGVSDIIHFPSPGVVVLPLLSRFGQRHQLRLNVTRNTFTLDADPAQHPVTMLESKLRAASPQLDALYHPRPRPVRRKSLLNDFAIALICSIFVLGGIWMTFTAAKPSDRLAGVVGVLLFGAGAVYSIITLRAQFKSQHKSPAIQRWSRFAPYLPLTFVALEFAWLVFLILAFIFIVGDSTYTSTPAKERFFDIVASLPAALGLALGILGIAGRWAVSTVAWACLILGSLGCTMFVADFAWGFFH
jgi:hypothetical protein